MFESTQLNLASKTRKLASTGALLASFFFSAKFLWYAASTINFPYQLEFMEGGVVETIEHVLQGKAIYGPPSIDYVAYLYTPLYFWVSAAMAKLLGIGFLAPRLVSFFAFLALNGLLARWVYRENRAMGGGTEVSLKWSMIGVGLLMASFDLSGRWFHLARVDTLAIALSFSAAYCLRFCFDENSRYSTRFALLASVLMWLAVMTKQSSGLMLAPVSLVFLWLRPKAALKIGFISLFLLGVTFAVLQYSSDGWFSYYTWTVPQSHETWLDGYVYFWTFDMAQFGVVLIAAIGATMLFRKQKSPWDIFYMALLFGFVGAAYKLRLHKAGWANVLIPAHLVTALLATIGAGVYETTGTTKTHREMIVVFTLLLCAQFGFLYNPTELPESEDAYADFMNDLGSTDGELLIPDLRWVQSKSGKKSFGLGMAARDVLRVGDPKDKGRVRLEAELRRAFSERRFTKVLLSSELPWVPLMGNAYRFDSRISNSIAPITGTRVRPELVWVPVAVQPK